MQLSGRSQRSSSRVFMCPTMFWLFSMTLNLFYLLMHGAITAIQLRKQHILTLKYSMGVRNGSLVRAAAPESSYMYPEMQEGMMTWGVMVFSEFSTVMYLHVLLSFYTHIIHYIPFSFFLYIHLPYVIFFWLHCFINTQISEVSLRPTQF